ATQDASRTLSAQWEGGVNPPSSVHMDNGAIGLYVNTETVQKVDIVGGGYHSTFAYLWNPLDGSAPRPWTEDSIGVNVSFKMKIPFIDYKESEDRNPNKAVGQVSLVMYGRDMSDPLNPKAWCYLVNIYDPRGEYTPFVSHD